MNEETFNEDLAGLQSAEEFLEYFGIDFDKTVVQVNRLHILQRFHNYLQGAGKAPEYETWKFLMTKAYEDFVHSDARTEGVFQVFKRSQGIATIPLSSIGRAKP
jgi:nitrogenase-stabilizing/protective protein